MQGWWTPDLVEAVRDIRERRDYDDNEIRELLRLLGAAQCPDPDLIRGLETAANWPQRAAAVATLLGGEYADAVAWLRRFAEVDMRGYDYDEHDEDGESYGSGRELTFEDLLADARAYLDHGEYRTQHGSQSWQDTFSRHRDEFWAKFELATGYTGIDRENTGSVYGCSC